MIGKLVTIAAGIAAGYALAHARREARGSNPQDRSRSAPEPLQRWENEGGAVSIGSSRTAGGAAMSPTASATAHDSPAVASITPADTPSGRDAAQLGGAPV